MAYLLFPNLAAAIQRSQDSWTTTLGRTKNPSDVTTYLWPWLIGLDGRVALDVTFNPVHLIAAGTVGTLDPVNWPPPPTIILT
jgi:hypothetical protein